MNNAEMALEHIMTWQVILFCLGIYVLSFVLRRVVEAIFPRVITGRWWGDAVLPTLPVVIGALIAIIAKKYPYPGDIHTLSGRIFFGGVCGFFSGYVYKMLKLALAKKGVTDDPAATAKKSDPPASSGPP